MLQYIPWAITGLVIIMAVFIVWNLLRKVERYEDILTQDHDLIFTQDRYLKQIYSLVHEADEHLKSLDERQVFYGDDEVGFFFQQMLDIQSSITEYIDLVQNGEKEKEKTE